MSGCCSGAWDGAFAWVASPFGFVPRCFALAVAFVVFPQRAFPGVVFLFSEALRTRACSGPT